MLCTNLGLGRLIISTTLKYNVFYMENNIFHYEDASRPLCENGYVGGNGEVGVNALVLFPLLKNNLDLR